MTHTSALSTAIKPLYEIVADFIAKDITSENRSIEIPVVLAPMSLNVLTHKDVLAEEHMELLAKAIANQKEEKPYLNIGKFKPLLRVIKFQGINKRFRNLSELYLNWNFL